MPRGGKRKNAGRKPAAENKDLLAGLLARKRLYLEGLAAGKTKLQSALEAGYAESVARTAKQNIETDDVREAFAQLIQKVIPAEKIVGRIVEGLDAMETKTYAFQGMIFDSQDLIAWTERREYAKLAAEYGRYFVPRTKVEGEVDHKHSGKVEVTVEFIGVG